MKKLLSILLIIIVMCVSFAGCASTTPTVKESESSNQNENQMDGVFRYANWGDSVETIEKKETNVADLKDNRGLLYKNVKLLTHNANAVYFFNNNGFKSGMYSIENTHTNENLYIDDFNSINKVLTQKYGEPTVNTVNWIRDVLKDDPGLALYYGDVEYVSIWELENLTVGHNLSCDNFEISHNIFYTNPDITVETDTSGL